MESKTICSAVGSGWCLLSDRMLCFSVSLRGTSGQSCVGDGDWRMCLGLEGAPSRLSDLPRDSQQTRIESRRCAGYCARRQGCNGDEMDRIPALIGTGERHTRQRINKGGSFRS